MPENVMEITLVSVRVARPPSSPSPSMLVSSLFQGDHLGVEFALSAHEGLLTRGGLLWLFSLVVLNGKALLSMTTLPLELSPSRRAL